MRRPILIAALGVALGAASSMAFAGGADGVWKTEVGSDGGYLEVTIGRPFSTVQASFP